MTNYHWEQIEDYLHCPFYYYFKWVKKKSTQKFSMDKMYREALKQTASYVFHMVGGERYPTWFQLKKKWEKLWVGHRDEKELMNETMYNYNKRNVYRQYEKKGIKALQQFHEDFKSPGFPILINKEITINFENNQITVPIDFIRQTKDDKIEVIQWSVESPNYTFLVKHDNLLTAQSYVFSKVANNKDFDLSIYSFDKNKWIHTERKERQYDLFENLVRIVINQIENNIFYPRYTEKCEECPFKGTCAKDGIKIYKEVR